jgi:hypothetical protein
MTALLGGLWGKVLAIGAGVCLTLAAMFCFLWLLAAGKAEREREARLNAEDSVAKLSEELIRSDAALLAAESRSSERQSAREELRDDETFILQNPVTRDCMASPAIRDALSRLRERRQGNQAERDSPE